MVKVDCLRRGSTHSEKLKRAIKTLEDVKISGQNILKRKKLVNPKINYILSLKYFSFLLLKYTGSIGPYLISGCYSNIHSLKLLEVPFCNMQSLIKHNSLLSDLWKLIYNKFLLLQNFVRSSQFT